MQQLGVAELAAWLGQADRDPPQLLDVREDWEVRTASIPSATHIPMREIPARLADLDPSRPVVCICHHGARSFRVALFLEQQGFQEVLNLAGGIDAWAREVDPRCPTY